jgi:rfaE bifunctional protein kinase chain/domain
MTISDLHRCVEGWQGKNVLVIGDAMLDVEIHTNRNAQGREPYGPTLKEQKVLRFPGGAANVAMNLRHLGARASLLSPIGTDDSGEWLKIKLKEERIDWLGEWMAARKSWSYTTTKTRIFRDDREFVCRIDRDAHLVLPHDASVDFIEKRDYDLVVFSDYLKGALSITSPQVFISRLLKKEKRVFLSANVKPATTNLIKGCDLLTINDLEYNIVQQGGENAYGMAERLGVWFLIQTLGRYGLEITQARYGTRTIHPHTVGDVDPVGAGDAVLAAASLALTMTEDLNLIGEIANAAGAAKCSKHGTRPIQSADLCKYAVRRVEKEAA